MIVPGSANSLLLRSAGVTAYQVERSIRLNAPDSAFLSRTPASAGNRKTWTWSGWVKRSQLSTQQSIFGNTPADKFRFRFETGNTLRILDGTNAVNLDAITTQLYRDTAAWYHIVLVVDTTQGTGSNRVKVYVNGVQQSLTYTNTPSLNQALGVNDVSSHSISNAAGQGYCDFYLADIHFVDGQALDPTSFAETNITTGQWVPKAFSGGSYGTNGFRLAFADNSNNTATTLGKDSSPNGNNWTPNNLSVTAGAGNDSLVDTPTSYGTDTGAGGDVRGNYATLNPLSNTAGALSDGNLRQAGTASTSVRTESTIAVSSGKWYFEVTPTALSGTFASLGIGTIGITNKYPGEDANSYSWYPQYVNKQNSTVATSYGSAVGVNGVVMVAFDLDNNKIFFGGDGTWFGSSNPATGTNPAFTINAGTYTPIFRAYDTGSAFAVNFGQRQWAYAAPAGFKALCDTNLPAPVVAKPNTAFDVALWTGNGSARNITGLNFNPDFVWIKGRSGATDHALYDVVRGTEKRLESNTTDAEVTSDGGVTAFNSDGFSLGTLAQVNTNSSTYVGWAFDGGTSTVTNTQGSITSSVRANASAGFSIVTYTGTGANGTVGHGLNVAPAMVIVKRRDSTSNWQVRHTSIAAASSIQLNLTNAAASATTVWNSTSPTSTVFSIGTDATVNASSATYIAYCFAPVAGYSSFGSYTGNGSADGPFVYTGFRPALVIVKMSSSTGNWTILDYQREGYNVDNDPLFPNLSNAEGTTDLIDLTSNGFKVRTTDATFNTNAGTYVYAAWAENPFQYARAR